VTRRRSRAAAFAFVVAVTAGAVAAGPPGAAAKADRHDRAAIRQLLARQLQGAAARRHCGKQKAAVSSGFVRLRGRDSNPNFLIQSQASYH
jgi:hypothetical protein